MTGSAVALRVARRARFKTLPRGLPVSQAEAAKGVVVTGPADSRRRDKSRLLVAALAELRWVVAIAASRFACVRRTRVAREEPLSVVARLPGTVRAVTFKTRRAHVTGLAGRRAGVRFPPVSFPELPRVTRRCGACPLRARPPSGGGGRHGRNGARQRSDMATGATLPRVTARARHRAGVRLRSVPFPEVPLVTRWRGACQPRAGRASRAGDWQRRNCARGRADVATRATLTRVTGRTGRCRSLCVPAMRAQKTGRCVTRWRWLRRRVGWWPFVERQRANHR